VARPEGSSSPVLATRRRPGPSWGRETAGNSGQPRCQRATKPAAKPLYRPVGEALCRSWHASGRGYDRPVVPGRLIRSLVAEDQSAEGVRDRTGPENPRSVLDPCRTGDPRTRVVASGHQGTTRITGRWLLSSSSRHEASRRMRLWSRRSEMCRVTGGPQNGSMCLRLCQARPSHRFG
jgi:hypothetical protein